jgi:hypothetical protein
MSKIKQEYYDLALETGGSHFPEVGGSLLSTFGDLLVKECIQIAKQNGDDNTADALAERFGVTYGVQL